MDVSRAKGVFGAEEGGDTHSNEASKRCGGHSAQELAESQDVGAKKTVLRKNRGERVQN